MEMIALVKPIGSPKQRSTMQEVNLDFYTTDFCTVDNSSRSLRQYLQSSWLNTELIYREIMPER